MLGPAAKAGHVGAGLPGVGGSSESLAHFGLLCHCVLEWHVIFCHFCATPGDVFRGTRLAANGVRSTSTEKDEPRETTVNRGLRIEMHGEGREAHAFIVNDKRILSGALRSCEELDAFMAGFRAFSNFGGRLFDGMSEDAYMDAYDQLPCWRAILAAQLAAAS